MDLQSFWGSLAGGTVVATLFGLWHNYFGKYLGQKGEHRAMHEDSKILGAIERMRVEILEESRDRQTQWNAKRDCHHRLLTALVNYSSQVLLYSRPPDNASKMAAEFHLSEVIEKRTALADLRIAMETSRLFIADTAVNVARDAVRELNLSLQNPDEGDSRRNKASQLMTEYIMLARADLGYTKTGELKSPRNSSDQTPLSSGL